MVDCQSEVRFPKLNSDASRAGILKAKVPGGGGVSKVRDRHDADEQFVIGVEGPCLAAG